MTALLYVEASPRKARSHSIAVARAFLDRFRAAHPDGTVDTLDLWTEPLPRFDGPTIDAKYAILSQRPHEAAERAAWAAVEAAVSRFTAADRFLFSVPMWNLGVPYVLKHYIDVVTQPTLTFSFSPEHGYRGLVAGRRATVIYASGGDYTPGSGNPRPDFQKPFFEAWLRFIGVDDIETVTVQPTIGRADRLDASRRSALARAAGLALDA